MVKIEFESINEIMDFAELILQNTPKNECTTVEMANNEKWLHTFDLQETIGKMQTVDINNTQKIIELEEQVKKLTVKEPVIIKNKKVEGKYNVKYPSSISYPKVQLLYHNGYFKLSNNHTSPYTINDILKLEKALKKGKDIFELTQLVKVGKPTVLRICYGIEQGYYDKYINEWEQIQANNFQSRVKPVETENNPQKRKEKGMI